MNNRCAVHLFLVLLFLAIPALSQSIPTATITGKVTAEGAAMPGVTVTVTSPNLQGERTTVTTGSGDYIVPLLPPGDYNVKYELSGMQTIIRTARLTAARTDKIDVALRPAAVAESITVTAEAPMTAAVESTQVSTNFKRELIEQLPLERNLRNITLLSPGVADTGPSGGNTLISGAMSFDSLYLVNGAVVNENLRGQPHNLFIEDAIQETTVLTGGISAEYGHFTGGVVSAITKSGGNDFSGSFRTNLTNEKWISKTPLTTAQEDKINPVYEATLGGPFLRDRLWFFGAGRNSETNDIRQTVPGNARAGDQDANGNAIPANTPIPPITYPHGREERRLEGKITGLVTHRQTLVASYLDIDDKESNQTGQDILDLDSLVPQRETPATLLALNYNGVFTDHFFVEGQYSKKDFAFVGSGSSFYDLIKGTLVIDRARGSARYWSPTFRKTPEGEQRDIRSYTAKATYFWPTSNIGTHEFRAGYEDFNEVRLVNNHQQGSDFRISVPNTIIRGNQIFPRAPGGSNGTLTRIQWTKIFVLSEGSDYTTRSVYLNDGWTLNNRWTFNIGARYDENDAISGDHTFTISDDATISPRLAAHYDLFGNGRLVLNGSYGHYVGRLAEGAANDGDPAGRQSNIQWNYRGPNINNDVNAPTSALIPTDKALQMIFDWFMSVGGTDLRPFRTTPSVPGVATIVDPDGLSSPLVKEWTVGAGTILGTRGYARADLVWRDWENFYGLFLNLGTGRAKDQFGTEFDRAIVQSDSDFYNRDYRALQTQFSYRLFDRFNVGGTYTYSRLTGNVTGEDTGSGPLVGDDAGTRYPEYIEKRWAAPDGYLTGDQRHRAKLYAAYDVPTPIGGFNFSVLQTFESARRSSADGVIDSRPYVTNPGYLTPPATVPYFFGGRGNLKADDITRTDFSINYKLQLARGIELFIQPEVVNLFNEQGVELFDEEILTAVDCPGGSGQSASCPAAGLKAFNPFTETPVEGVHWQKGPNFGEPTEEDDFQVARTYRVSLGLRF